MNSLGVDTGVDLEKLVDVSAWISALLHKTPSSKVIGPILAKRASEVLCRS